MAVTPKKNIELKARCADLLEARTAAIGAGARVEGILRQVDTYFVVPYGRLKLREINDERAELIQYHRSNEPEVRASSYHVIPVPDAAGMKAALVAALGLRGEVRKRRELLMFHNVRIHLDEVEGLGTFLEFEAVVSERDAEPVCLERLELLRRAMNVRDEDRIAVSYSDLMGL